MEEKTVQVTEQVAVQVKEELLEKIGLEENVLQLSKDQDKLAKLWTAYSKYLGEITNPKKTKKAAFSNYSPLEEVLSAVNPVLSKFGLGIMQTSYAMGDKHVGITTVLSHSDGAYIVFPPMRIPLQKTDAQGFGTAVTYGRRYGYCTVSAIAGEEDTDGSTHTDDKPKKPAAKPEIKIMQDKITALAKTMSAAKRRDEALKLIGHEGKVGQIKTVKEAKEVIVKLEEALKGDK
jgi:hypothetical protein